MALLARQHAGSTGSGALIMGMITAAAAAAGMPALAGAHDTSAQTIQIFSRQASSSESVSSATVRDVDIRLEFAVRTALRDLLAAQTTTDPEIAAVVGNVRADLYESF